MLGNLLEEHSDEYLSGGVGRDSWPISEDIFERPVRDVKRRTWLAMDEDVAVSVAAKEMVSRRIGSVMVTRSEKLVGILTERDLLNEMVENPFNPRETSLSKMMRTGVVVLSCEDTVARAIHRMSQGGHRRLPIVDDQNRPVGLVSVRDIVDYLAVLFPHKILTLPPGSQKIPTTREGG
jgi:CBS domain-containing protein